MSLPALAALQWHEKWQLVVKKTHSMTEDSMFLSFFRGFLLGKGKFSLKVGLSGQIPWKKLGDRARPNSATSAEEKFEFIFFDERLVMRVLKSDCLHKAASQPAGRASQPASQPPREYKQRNTYSSVTTHLGTV